MRAGIRFVLVAGIAVFSGSGLGASKGKAPLAEAEPGREERMEWWREARFGMFVHWGLYSGLAGTWKGEVVSKRGGMEWIQNRVKADTWEYAHEAAPSFRPNEDFAREWAQLAKAAGCKYVVFTTKHHDGFALHDSQVSTFDAKDLVGRDLCKEITDALKAEGLKVGFYHSVIDWHHPQYDYEAAGVLPHPLKGKASPNGPRRHELYVDYLHAQAEELMSGYGDIDVLWWDYSKKGAEGPFWRADELMEMVRRHQPDIVSNNRLYRIAPPNESSKLERMKTWDPKHGDFTTPEQHIPATGIPGVDWEVCMTMNTTWGFSEHDHAWKSDEKLIRNLVDIVSKGGNYLLNVGPKADGTIPEESVRSMAAIGRWMEVNSESIYGTQASPFETPDWGRYTSKGRMLYAHVFDWPEDGRLKIGTDRSEVARVYMLGDSEGRDLPVEVADEGSVVVLPKAAPDAIVSVLAIERK